MLPFTHEQFLAVFAEYNSAVWPAQLAAYLLGMLALAATFMRGATGGRVAGAALALMWLWTGLGYHALFFTQINKAAFLFAALFVAQSGFLLHALVSGDGLRFGEASAARRWVGYLMIAYAAVLYPLIGMLAGYSYPAMPAFGITPCPVTIFTFGVLLLGARPSRRLLVIPFLWSLIGGSAAFLLQVPQDWLLLVSGLIAVPLILGAHGTGAGKPA